MINIQFYYFQTYYVKAMDAYNDGNWEKAASNFEKSLNHYYREEEKCRAKCENGYVHTKFPDFINAIGGKCLIKESQETTKQTVLSITIFDSTYNTYACEALFRTVRATLYTL